MIARLRKIRSLFAALLLLLVVLIGVTLRQFRQARLNNDLVTALLDYRTIFESDSSVGGSLAALKMEANKKRCSLKALAALKAGADPSCRAYIDKSGKIERPTWREQFLPILWPFGNRKNPNHTYMSALGLALLDRDPKLVKALLERNADVNARVDVSNMLNWANLPNPPTLRVSALGGAVLLGEDDLVKLLLEHGADIDQQQTWVSSPPSYSITPPYKVSSSLTPLMLATGGNARDIVRLLLQRGANVNMRTQEGQTALDFAFAGGPPAPSDTERRQVIQMLKAAGAKR